MFTVRNYTNNTTSTYDTYDSARLYLSLLYRGFTEDGRDVDVEDGKLVEEGTGKTLVEIITE